jgi:hypothetical protein
LSKRKITFRVFTHNSFIVHRGRVSLRLLPSFSHVTYIFALAAHAVGRVFKGGGVEQMFERTAIITIW